MNIVRKLIMSEFSPEVLLSSSSREQCVANLRELPAMTDNKSVTNTAGILVPICVVDGEVSLLYTLRSTQLKRNSGQVSFPGGKCDKDETIIETAIRETEEEVGFPSKNVEVWEQMKPVRGTDPNMKITPVVALLKDFDMNSLKPNIDEVEAVFMVTIKDLCDPQNHGYFEYVKQPLPVFLAGKYKIWGITGIVTHSFLKCFVEKKMLNSDFLRKKFEMSHLNNSKPSKL